MHQFKAAIFDMDGLLLDSEILAFKSFRQTSEKHNLGDLDDLFRQLLGTNHETGQALLRQGLNNDALFEQFSTDWMEQYRKITSEKPVPLKPGVEQLLGHCEQLGLMTAVATSTHTEQATSRLDASGILHFFSYVVGGDQVNRSKPKPDIYQFAAAKLDAEVDDCIAFEDSHNGVLAAISAGMTVVQIPDLVQPNEELLKLGPIVLKSLNEVIDFRFQRA